MGDGDLGDLARTRRKTTTTWQPGKVGLFPWRTSSVFLFGGLAVVALVAIATAWAVPHIEANLEKETEADLMAAGIDLTDIQIDYQFRNGAITGAVPARAGSIGPAVEYSGIRTLSVVVSEIPETPKAETEPTPEPADSDPDPVALGSTNVTADIADGRILLVGEVLSEGQRASLIAAATDALGSGAVDDQLAVTGMAPEVDGADQRVDSMAGVLGALTPDVTGRATLSDEQLTFVGSTPDDEVAGLIRTATDSAIGVVPSTDITVRIPTVEDEVDLLSDELELLADELRSNVTFELGSEQLTATSKTTLDKVVALLELYALPSLSIEGHTDSTGPADVNLELSRLRAEAVMAYLVENGVDPSRLAAVGFGETMPIVPDDAEGVALENRRVELLSVAELP